MIYALQTVTDKIYMGNVVSGPNAADTIKMTEILFGGGAGADQGRASIEATPATISLINCNSPPALGRPDAGRPVRVLRREPAGGADPVSC